MWYRYKSDWFYPGFNRDDHINFWFACYYEQCHYFRPGILIWQCQGYIKCLL
jgi:hypothetical protein